MRPSEFKHILDYINWNNEAELIKCSTEEFGKQLERLQKKGGMPTKAKTKREEFADYNYRIETTGNWKRLYYYDKGFKILSTNVFDEKRNERPRTRQALVVLKDKFKEETGLGNKAFSKAFGTVKAEFKNCIPKQFYYMNKEYITTCKEDARFKGQLLTGIDDSSHYPSCGCGRLPDSNTAVCLNGYVEPTEEFPFAFYIKSGFCAEYGVFDTRSWVSDLKWGPCLFDKKKWKENAFYREDEITVLMKASQYELTECWKYFYAKRKEDPEAKLVMNASIGQMHQKDVGWKRYDRFPYAHIAAVIIARANQKHLNMIKKIGENNIVQVCVDGLIYKNNGKYGADKSKKDLGVYVTEFKYGYAVFKGTNTYVIKVMPSGEFKIRLSGYNAWKDGRPLINEEFDGNHPEAMWDLCKIDKTKRGENYEEEI